MGCTSSAPSTLAPTAPASPASHVHATVQTELMDISEDRMQLAEMKDESVSTELPVCDTVEEAVLSAAAGGVVVAVSAAAIAEAADMPSPGPEPDTLPPIEVHNVEVPEATAESPTAEDKPASESDEKLTRLEEVVEKVVELHVAGELEATSAEATTEEAEAQGAPSESQPEEAEQESDDEAEEEPASPSQSASSRATRWEALADIAAELPPSLTVDPLTGQIYALSK
ncbi:cytochrome c1 [Plutella xylostella]|uniref:cytochrome c1 n=1 Tax=Plutella xylostella TaxID=51655 RepID=UPI002032FD4D|nr:cytochrome c1 [Plutella xylostella]